MKSILQLYINSHVGVQTAQIILICRLHSQSVGGHLSGKMGKWENGKMEKCENGKMENAENGKMGKWENGKWEMENVKM